MRAYPVLLLSLAAIWGASFMFIEIGLEGFEPTALMAGRLVVAVIVLVALMAVQGTLRRLRRAGRMAFALGVINSAVPFTLFAWLLPGAPASWYDAGSGGILFPYRTFAAVVGLILIPAVSRLTVRWSPPQPLRNVATESAGRSGDNITEISVS